jgi:hypothetical protein
LGFQEDFKRTYMGLPWGFQREDKKLGIGFKRDFKGIYMGLTRGG